MIPSYAPNTDSLHDHVRYAYPNAKARFDRDHYVFTYHGVVVATARPHPFHEGWNITATQEDAVTAEQTNEGDIFEVTDGDKPTGRLYTRVPMDRHNPHVGHVRAKQINHPDGLIVDIGNGVTVRIVKKAGT